MSARIGRWLRAGIAEAERPLDGGKIAILDRHATQTQPGFRIGEDDRMLDSVGVQLPLLPLHLPGLQQIGRRLAVIGERKGNSPPVRKRLSIHCRAVSVSSGATKTAPTAAAVAMRPSQITPAIRKTGQLLRDWITHRANLHNMVGLPFRFKGPCRIEASSARSTGHGLAEKITLPSRSRHSRDLGPAVGRARFFR